MYLCSSHYLAILLDSVGVSFGVWAASLVSVCCCFLIRAEVLWYLLFFPVVPACKFTVYQCRCRLVWLLFVVCTSTFPLAPFLYMVSLSNSISSFVSPFTTCFFKILFTTLCYCLFWVFHTWSVLSFVLGS